MQYTIENTELTLRSNNAGFSYDWLLRIGALTTRSGDFTGYFGEGFKIASLCSLAYDIEKRALLRFSWLIFIGFQAQFSALKQNLNSIVFKEPEATRCRLDRLNPADESLGDCITDLRSRPRRDAFEAGRQHPRDLPDGNEPAANRPRVP